MGLLFLGLFNRESTIYDIFDDSVDQSVSISKDEVYKSNDQKYGSSSIINIKKSWHVLSLIVTSRTDLLFGCL